MPSAATKRDNRLPYEELSRRASIIVRERGHRSINAACRAVGANWMTIYRSLRLGLSPGTTKGVKDQLRSLGLYELALNGR